MPNCLQYCVALLLFLPQAVFAQIGGISTYSFLNVPLASRTSALAGENVSLKDGDPTLVWNNPAILDTSYDGNAAISYNNYLADINAGSALYCRSVEKIGMLHAGIQYMSYGSFDRADVTGQITGEFKAKDYVFHAGFARVIDSLFSVGGNMKFITSFYDQYTSSGVALDFGVHYYKPIFNLSMGLVIQNFGYQLGTYSDNNREALPFEIQYGLTKRFSHAPLRLNITCIQLQKWDLTNSVYYTSSFDKIGGELIQKKIAVLDNLMRHIVGGVEFIPSKNFHVQLGYNYMRRQDMRLVSRAGTAGISWGVGVKISKFRINFSHAGYHFGGSLNQISLSTDLNRF